MRLHQGPDVLVLPNAWDCASARIFEEAGFPAIATTSAGIANSLGYADGEHIAREEMLAVVRRIAACVTVPVTADLEAGYDDIGKTAAGMIEGGAVGLNLEDGGADPETLVRKIAAVRQTGADRGIHVVINARTDLYLYNLGDAESRFDRACERLSRYRDAGADCLFVPGVTDEETIRKLVDALRYPINVLATAGLPGLARLRELGIARVSVGSGIARATLGLIQRAAHEIRNLGAFGTMLDGAMPYRDANLLFNK